MTAPLGGSEPTPRTGSGTLDGVTVVVTRTREQSAALVGPLEAEGADVVAFPVISVIDPEDWSLADEAIGELASYDWVVFSSVNAVDRFLNRLETLFGVGVDGLEMMKVAVVGAATAKRLERAGRSADLMPEDYRAEGLIEVFAAMEDIAGLRVLVPRALEAREIFPNTLRGLGATVDVVPVYRTVRAEPEPDALARITEGGVDVVTFTSPSTVRNFVGVLEEAGVDILAFMADVVTASIGPVTSAALEELDVPVGVEPTASTVPALVDSIVGRFAERR